VRAYYEDGNSENHKVNFKQTSKQTKTNKTNTHEKGFSLFSSQQ